MQNNTMSDAVNQMEKDVNESPDTADTTASEADQAVQVACKQLDAGVLGRQPRFNQIKKNEDMQNGFNPPALKGRSNVPFDGIIMRGYLNTLHANTDEDVLVEYDRAREQDYKSAQLMSAAWLKEASPQRGDWNNKIMDAKKLAGVSGRGHLKLFCTSSPKFKTDLEVVDHYDMVTEPMGGAYLDKHLYKFQMNIFRTKEDLLAAAKDGFYDKGQVRKLIFNYNSPDVFKTNLDIYKNKNNRFLAFGIDIEANAYVGQRMYRLVEGAFQYKGKWMYILFNYETKTWIRYQRLEEVYPWAKQFEGRGAIVSFPTHRDPFIYWSMAPADDIRPVAYTAKKILNLTIDNLEKRGWDMKAYDPKMFTDPTQLLYRQDGIVRATIRPGQRIEEGIMQLQTPDTSGVTINMVTFMDQFLGQKTGITNQDQGTASTDKVGIAYVNMQASSKRMTLENKMFAQALHDLGDMFRYACGKYLREAYAVKLIGIKGISWEEEITAKDAQKEFTTVIKAGNFEEKKTALAAQKKEAMLARITADPDLKAQINKKWYAEEVLKTGDLPPAEMKRAMDVNNDGDEEIMSEAAEAIDEIIQGKTPKLNPGATSGYVAKVLNYAVDNEEDMDHDVYMKLMAFAQAHIKYATDNMARAAASVIAQKGINPAAGAGIQPGAASTAAPLAPKPIAPAIAPLGAPGASRPGVPKTALQ